jgi:hypothetical protein
MLNRTDTWAAAAAEEVSMSQAALVTPQVSVADALQGVGANLSVLAPGKGPQVAAVTNAVGAVVAAEPGWQTTEFWVTVVTQIIGLLIVFKVIHISNDQTQAILGIVGLVLPQLFYALGRSIRKRGTTA